MQEILEKNSSILAYKVLLPNKLAGDLLILCNKFNISAATLFLGYNGSEKAVLDFRRAKIRSGKL
nr:hypothetical protein [uncultured Tolumonas sp.]